MYTLSEQQIDYILNDIRARGVETESLQLNLLDHVCCIVEQELEPDGDFYLFYQLTIRRFYKTELKEIEEETNLLLTFKNYYAMKKIMLISGGASALLIILAIAFKFMHMAGAAALLVVGISCFSLCFLPLVFLLKLKEQQNAREKIIAALGTLSGVLFSLAILFKIMFWPGANMLGVATLALMSLFFLPLYFFNGMRKPDARVNTIVTSVLIVAICGLFLALVRTPANSRMQLVNETGTYVRNQQLLNTERRQLLTVFKDTTMHSDAMLLTKRIDDACEELKAYIIQYETGQPGIDNDFERKNTLISDTRSRFYFEEGSAAYKKLMDLRSLVEQYNSKAASLGNNAVQAIPVKQTVLDLVDTRVITALNDLVQIQMCVAQNTRELAYIN